MSGLDFYTIGARPVFGTHTFEPDEIIAFAKKYDPQPFHLDAELARNSMFGGLCASGWHTAGVWMRKNYDFLRTEFARIEAEGGTPPMLGPSPGFRDLRWLKPVYAGETISFGTEVKAKRELKSKPGWGLVESSGFAERLDGTPVMTFDSAVLVGV